MFRGRYLHTIDQKGRLSIPVKYRDIVGHYTNKMLVVVPNEVALEVHPLEEWERLETRIYEQSMFDSNIRRLGRLYTSRAKEVELDAVGRILLPQDSREQTGLTKAVTLIGPGRKYFEVWDSLRFEEYEHTDTDGLVAAFTVLAGLRV